MRIILNSDLVRTMNCYECFGGPRGQRYMHRHNIIMRHQTGIISVSPEVQGLIEREVAFSFGEDHSQSH